MSSVNFSPRIAASSSAPHPSVSQCLRARMGFTCMRLPSDRRVSATPKIPSPFDASGNVDFGMSGTVLSPPLASNVKSPMPKTNGTDRTCNRPCVKFRLSHGYALQSWYTPLCGTRASSLEKTSPLRTPTATARCRTTSGSTDLTGRATPPPAAASLASRTPSFPRRSPPAASARPRARGGGSTRIPSVDSPRTTACSRTLRRTTARPAGPASSLGTRTAAARTPGTRSHRTATRAGGRSCIRPRVAACARGSDRTDATRCCTAAPLSCRGRGTRCCTPGPCLFGLSPAEEG
eukprot:31342-Pelagococcus_subviridis.AAC.17